MKIPDSFYSVEFSKAAMFGYKTEEVDLFVETAFRFLDELQTENNRLNSMLEQKNTELEKFHNDEEMLRTALAGSHKLAYEQVQDAKQQAAEILDTAQREADNIIASIARKKQELEYSYQRESTAVAEFKNKVFELYAKHIEILQSIPESAKLAIGGDTQATDDTCEAVCVEYVND